MGTWHGTMSAGSSTDVCVTVLRVASHEEQRRELAFVAVLVTHLPEELDAGVAPGRVDGLHRDLRPTGVSGVVVHPRPPGSGDDAGDLAAGGGPGGAGAADTADALDGAGTADAVRADRDWRPVRREIVRESMAIAVATGAYGISFGAISLAAGLNVWQTMALSALMFTGASQFGLVGVVAGGGAPLAGAATAIMLGARNALYGLRMSELLQVRGLRRFGAAQLVIDESTAMAIGRWTAVRESRLGFYATGMAVFVLWNLGTLIGVLGASWLSDPRVLGLDAAVPAAFLALLAPRLRDRESLGRRAGRRPRRGPRRAVRAGRRSRC